MIVSYFSVQRSAFSVQRSAFSVQRSAFSVQRSAFSVQRSAKLFLNTAKSQAFSGVNSLFFKKSPSLHGLFLLSKITQQAVQND
ncbi:MULTISPECIES: hypothetical protein [unclassified Moraxella]|uniref:hypothetical protein n=1 Tax=unclassified Moraxella TaxID=2685852 RepID=UPI002B4159A9|nr:MULTISPECIES: hypothetical protein [unclassified Moraxella]